MICYRMGMEDAEVMAKEFAPTFNEYDLINIERLSSVVKLMINGTGSKPFNMGPLPMAPAGSKEMADAVRQLSRLKYGKPREEIESYLLESSKVAEAMSSGTFDMEKGL